MGRRASIVALGLAILACTGSASSENTMTPDQLLSALDQLARPFARDGVQAALGVPLTRDAASNKYFTVYKGSSEQLGTVELREPTDSTSPRQGLLLVEPAGGLCVSRTAVDTAFGPGTRGPKPPPGRGGSAPRYQVHAQEWGTVKTRFTSDCLAQIVLDANG